MFEFLLLVAKVNRHRMISIYPSFIIKATVLRQSNATPFRKSQYGENFSNVISVRTAPEGSSSPSETTVSRVFRVLSLFLSQLVFVFRFFNEAICCREIIELNEQDMLF